MREIGRRIWKDIKEYWQAGAAICIYTIVVNLIFHAFCPMVILTGLPCPGCGISRSLAYLLKGHLMESVQIQPMGIVIAAACFYIGFWRYVLGRKVKGIKGLIGMIAVLLLGYYIYGMYHYFPNRVPYVYTKGNVLEQVVTIGRHFRKNY